MKVLLERKLNINFQTFTYLMYLAWFICTHNIRIVCLLARKQLKVGVLSELYEQTRLGNRTITTYLKFDWWHGIILRCT